MNGKAPGGMAASAIAARRKLRVLGTYITLLEPIRRQAEADLGFEISFESHNFRKHPIGTAFAA